MTAMNDATAETHGTASTGPATVAGDELPRGATLGRYVVLDVLGAGAMGVVYAAFDPELDRKVALKLLRSDHAVGRARLLREAQALARLAHPNVVAVHDVGATERHVFLAMEFVRGATLTKHLATRAPGWADALALFVAVGRGLAAAHAAGLVHRDLKPDNVMIGDDGRARVLDFGLARAGEVADAEEGLPAATARPLETTLTRPGRMLGTPRYMAPEQWLGTGADARSDQFALCVALWEAVFGEHPFAAATVPALMAAVTAGKLALPARPGRAPAWLRRVLVRGLAVDPAARWSSIDALLAALVAGRVRTRRRWIAGGLVIAAGVVGAAIGGRSLAEARARAQCEAAGTSITAVWDDAARDALRAALVGSGIDHAAASFEHAAPWIDRWTAEWSRVRAEVCVAAEVEDRVEAAIAAKADACLDERRDALQALLAALHVADAAAVAQAVPAAAGLPAPAACADWAALARTPALPEDASQRAQVAAQRHALVQARALAAAGRPADGFAAAEAALVAIAGLGQPALTAEAQALVGHLAHRSGAAARAEEALLPAVATALELEADEVAATAAIALAQVVGHAGPRHAEGVIWGRVAEPLVRRLGQFEGVLGAELRSARGLVEQARGAYAEATAQHEEALAIRTRELGPEHPAVATTLVNLAVVHGLRGEREQEAALFERALALQEKALGPDHPEVARTLHNLAIGLAARGELDAALARQTRAQGLWRRALPADHPDVIAATMNLARIHHERGEDGPALALGEQALAQSERSLGPDHPEFAHALNNVASIHWDRGDTAKAQALLARSMAIQEKVLGPDHADLAIAAFNLASVHKDRGEVDAAAAMFARALAIQEKVLGPDHPITAHALGGLAWAARERGQVDEQVRLLGRAIKALGHPDAPPGQRGGLRLDLARALWARDRARAREVATEGLADLRAAGDPEAIAAAEAWLAAHK